MSKRDMIPGFKWYVVQLRTHTRAKMMKERKERQPADNSMGANSDWEARETLWKKPFS